MKRVLHFLDENEFERFVSQLFSEHYPSFQAIEGSGGDGGLDGLDGKTAYQMFFPEQKNRTKAKYIAKIDDSLAKLQKTIAKEGLDIERLIFVVPEDLRSDVVIYLAKKTKETGIECLHWGATRLEALLTKYPHIRDAFPEVFLPDVKADLGEVKSQVAELGLHARRSSDAGVEIITDAEYREQRAAVQEELNNQLRGVQIRFGGSSAAQAAGKAYHDLANKKLNILQSKKAASDRFYELEEQEINDFFEKKEQQVQSQHAARGTLNSGFANKDVSDVNRERHRELEKLRLKYGKEN